MTAPYVRETEDDEAQKQRLRMAQIADWMRRKRSPAPRDATRAPTRRVPTMGAADVSRRGGLTGYDIPEPSMGQQVAEAGASWLPPVDVPLALKGAKKAIGGDAMGGAGMMALSMAGLVPMGKIVAQGKVAARNLKKGAVAGIRELSPEAARAASLRGDHLKQGPDGQYIGGPRGVNSAARLGDMRRKVDAVLDRGAGGGNWYTDARAGNIEVAGPDPSRQRLIAREEGLWSPQATPDTNLGELTRAHNAYEIGKPMPIARTGAQASKYRLARLAGKDIPLGPKTGEFANKLDPTEDISHIPVNDIWQGEVFGYTGLDGKPMRSGYTRAQHAFMDAETTRSAIRANERAAGGKTDWDAASAQAAPWVVKKGEDLNRRFPKKYPTVDDGIAEAVKTYPDHFPKYTAFGTHEAIPGANTGHLEGLESAGFAERASYSNDPRSQWADEHGRDVMYDALGFYQRPINNTTGFYRNAAGVVETNPGRASRPLIGFKSDKAGKLVDDASREGMSAVEATRAFVDGQEMGAWHKMLPGQQVKVSRSASIPHAGPLNTQEMTDLSEAVTPYGFNISDTGDGVSLMNGLDTGGSRGPVDGGALKKLLAEAPDRGMTAGKKKIQGPQRASLGAKIEGALPRAKGPIDVARLDADAYFTGLERENAGSGKATAKLLDMLEANPTILDKFDASASVRQRVLDRMTRDSDVAARTGRPVRADLQQAREIIATKGFKGLRQALQAGVVLPAVGLMVMRSAEQSEPPA